MMIQKYSAAILQALPIKECKKIERLSTKINTATQTGNPQEHIHD